MSPTMIHEMMHTFSTLLSLELLYFSYNNSRDPTVATPNTWYTPVVVPGIERPSAGGRALHRRALIHRPAARDLRRAHRCVAARRLYGVLDLPLLGLHEVLGEGPPRPLHRRPTERSHQSVTLP